MNRYFIGIVLTFMSLFGAIAHSKTWPEKEITMIVPFPAGGTVDRIARSFAEDLPKLVNKPVIVKNVPGANSIAAINELLNNDPNHTFIVSLGSLVYTSIATNSNLYLELLPNMIVGSSRTALFKNKTANTAEFLQGVRSNVPVLITSGDTVDNGQMWLLSMENTNMQMVPFKGAPDMIRSVMQNEPKWGSCSIFCIWNFVKNEQIDVAFVSGDKRSQFFPNVPTAKELGLKAQPYNFDSIYLIASNRRIQPEVAEQMNAALKKVGTTNANIQNFGKVGLDLDLTNIVESAKIWRDQEQMAQFYFRKQLTTKTK